MISADIVHIHSGISILRLFHIIVCLLLFKKTIVTVHRDINIEKRKKLTRFFLRRCSKIILVNQVSYDFVTENYKKSNSFLIPAFLPPILENEPELPSEVKMWIGNYRSQHGFYCLPMPAISLSTMGKTSMGSTCVSTQFKNLIIKAMLKYF